MDRKFKILVSITVFILFLGGAYMGYNALTDSYRPERPGFSEEENDEIIDAQNGENEQVEAPDFTVTDQDGNSVRLSDFSGKPVIINFWASWCPPCREEMPDFNNVYLDYREDIHFLMINQTDGQRETREDAERFLEEGDYDFPVFFDENLEAGSAYGISALPTTVFINSDGYLMGGIPGAIDEETLREVISTVF